MKSFLLAALLTLTGTAVAQTLAGKDRACAAIAVFKESNTESLVGSRAVLDVIFNRAKKAKKSICAIIKEKAQFSFVRKRMSWKPSQEMLERFAVVEKMKRVFGEDVLWFHNREIRQPKWARKMKMLMVIGQHKFYKERT